MGVRSLRGTRNQDARRRGEEARGLLGRERVAQADPQRERKLLAHRREIKRLHASVRERGFTLVPLSLYFDEKGRVKVDLALARGKHTYDKREAIKRRDEDRESRRSLRRGVRN